eukprot:GHVN01038378.1.p1 GENE.GHVN01038378.1~~GHVN01038378.1.p1  ORF type:complete len:395 (+),score=31.23 GHVN01038378.1:454-1638(+)
MKSSPGPSPQWGGLGWMGCSPLGAEWIWLAVCLVAYCAQPLLVDVIRYNGGANSSTFLFLMPHYLAMVCVGLFYPSEARLRDCNWRIGGMLSFLDIINQLLKKGGLVYAGAAAYIVVDSSSIVWTALWSKLILGSTLSNLQWIGLATISVGMAIKARTLDLSFNNDEFYGVSLIFLSTVIMGLLYVLNQRYMQGEQPISGPTLVFMMGVCCSCLIILWTLVWTLPRFDQLVTSRIAAMGGDNQVVGVCFFGLFLAGVAHSATFWYIMSVYGAVSSGVLKGAKVAIVFLLSHILFCGYQESQCLNFVTTLSCVTCVSGVCLYSYATSRVVKEVESVDDLKRDRLRWLHGDWADQVIAKRGLQDGSSMPSLLTPPSVKGRRFSYGDCYKITSVGDK